MKKWQGLSKEMTLEEKVALIHGADIFKNGSVPRLGIPALDTSDGPNGVRQEFREASWIPVGDTSELVCWMPSNTCLASTWNKELAEDFGEVLGDEARGRGKDVILAPGINIKRTPLCGRNFEYMSEDPVHAGKLAAPLIRGIQKKDVAACVKHYVANNQELERMSVEAIIDEKTLQELYIRAFHYAIKEGKSYSIMAAYNRFNGEYCCNNKHLLVDILRDQWGYDGVVISDWGGVQDTDNTADHGVDMEMSVLPFFDNYFLANPLLEKVKSGEISEDKIDEKVERILCMMDRLHVGDKTRYQGAYNTKEHSDTVEAIAEEGIVLLKNEDGHLPISHRKEDETYKKILVVGDNATRNNGLGGGSSEIKMLYAISPLLGLHMVHGGDVKYKWMPGYYVDNENKLSINDEWQATSLEQAPLLEFDETKDFEQLVQDLVMPPDEDMTPEEKERDYRERIEPKQRQYREDVLNVVSDFDEVIFIGGLNHAYDVEGFDKKDIKLPYAQDELINALADRADNLTVVLMCGSAVEMPWIDKVKSLIQMSYAGQNAGLALAKIIYGEVNPSGKLPETYPISLSDTPTEKYGSYPGEIGSEGHRVCEYKEKQMVGYRYYETEDIRVRFPFGFGLSYTSFDTSAIDERVEGEGDDLMVVVSGFIKNTGSRYGKETLQLYIGSPEADRPVKELKDFTKIGLNPGESKSFKLEIKAEELKTYDEEVGEWKLIPGEYKLFLGTSVKDIIYTSCFKVQ